MSDPVVEAILMPPLLNVHAGSGPYLDQKRRVVSPGSVPGEPTKLLTETTITASAYCYFFRTTDIGTLPSHFGAAVSPNVKDFSNVNVFFHPNPGHAHMNDADYPVSGAWPGLYRYVPMLGLQLSASDKQQILIMPFIPPSEYDTTGDLVREWRPIFNDIAQSIQQDVTGSSAAVDINSMVVSSFSTGIKASASFRSKAAKIRDVLSEVWDMDGLSSDEAALSRALHSGGGVKVIQYKQNHRTQGKSFFVGEQRWYGLEPKLKDVPKAKDRLLAVHRSIPRTLFYHMSTESSVG